MADFPGKVSTQTSSQEPQRSFGIPSSVDMNFIKSIPGILLLAEILMVFYSVAAVLYLTAFLANAASVHYGPYHGHLGTSAVTHNLQLLLLSPDKNIACGACGVWKVTGARSRASLTRNVMAVIDKPEGQSPHVSHKERHGSD
ncbi:hypothetical protein DPX16_17114 [Anabarilius grahami]|uniref:Uncharacterized protein n=1 Tax=Anabarilius grahami TaxID=495550 RepID=A0A3N0YAN1_ANAGA|nr:hypothetical protein DPX16_17114 [Anabarilius grahami]